MNNNINDAIYYFLIQALIRAVEKGSHEGAGGGVELELCPPPPPPEPELYPPSPPPFPGAKVFFPRKIGKHKTFTCEKHVRLQLIHWARHKWQKVDIFFYICRFSNHSHHQIVCKFLFFMRNFVKTKSNIMFDSF